MYMHTHTYVSWDMVTVQVVDNERPWLNRIRREVETQAKKMLAQGMEYAVCEYVCTLYYVLYVCTNKLQDLKHFKYYYYKFF